HARRPLCKQPQMLVISHEQISSLQDLPFENRQMNCSIAYHHQLRLDGIDPKLFQTSIPRSGNDSLKVTEHGLCRREPLVEATGLTPV
ncbi:MAG: hypothetical protein WBB60_18935, partial [Nitrospira sp.]